jgi:hypothetical protein
MPPGSVLFGASGGTAAVVVAYSTILPELELIPRRLFTVSTRLKAKHLGSTAFVVAVVSLWIDRSGSVTHSAWLGGCMTGWLYAHLLGYGRTSRFQRMLHERRAAAERYRQLTPTEIIAEEIDPVLEKIARSGMNSLTRAERRILTRAHQRIISQSRVEPERISGH